MQISNELRRHAMEFFECAQSAVTEPGRALGLSLAQFWLELAQKAEHAKRLADDVIEVSGDRPAIARCPGDGNAQ